MRGKNDKENNQRAFEAIFNNLSDVVYRLCLYKTSDVSVAEDITQETFLRLWKSISAGKEIENPKAYVYQIARNLITDHYKQHKTQSLDSLHDDGFDAVSEASSPEVLAEVSILKQTIDALDSEFRDVLYFRLVEEMGVKEIAQILGISENLVSVRIHRGKTLLKQHMK